MHRVLILLVALVASAACFAQPSIPNGDPECNHGGPPAGAGERRSAERVLAIFPRNAAIDKNYRGCQTTWMETPNGWRRIIVTYWREGALQLFWGTDEAGLEQIYCQYIDGKASGKEAQECPDVERIRRSSITYPGGCLTRSRDGAGAQPGCDKNDAEVR